MAHRDPTATVEAGPPLAVLDGPKSARPSTEAVLAPRAYGRCSSRDTRHARHDRHNASPKSHGPKVHNLLVRGRLETPPLVRTLLRRGPPLLGFRRDLLRLLRLWRVSSSRRRKGRKRLAWSSTGPYTPCALLSRSPSGSRRGAAGRWRSPPGLLRRRPRGTRGRRRPLAAPSSALAACAPSALQISERAPPAQRPRGGGNTRRFWHLDQPEASPRRGARRRVNLRSARRCLARSLCRRPERARRRRRALGIRARGRRPRRRAAPPRTRRGLRRI
mmetsp:Transcript_14698/g.52324  ORF Transcript_14698/g.52324 Transcript_14698/m.52324 type:complete len:275 (-) Transcript_14698:233-1057(-)